MMGRAQRVNKPTPNRIKPAVRAQKLRSFRNAANPPTMANARRIR